MTVAMYLNFIRFLEKAHLAFHFILDRTQTSAEQVLKNKTTVGDVNKRTRLFCNSFHSEIVYTPLMGYYFVTIALFNSPFCLKCYY